MTKDKNAAKKDSTLVVLTVAIDTESKSLAVLSTDISQERIPDVIAILRGIEDNLIAQLVKGDTHATER